MKSTLYDNIFRYLSVNPLPSIIIEKKSRYAIKNFKSIASDYMVKEGSLYKVCFKSTSNTTSLRCSLKKQLVVVFLITGECPKVFEDLGVRKKVEKWQFEDEFGRISG